MLGKHPSFVIHEDAAFNGGSPLDLLVQGNVTPKELFFVRNHGTIPSINDKAFRLKINGWVVSPLELSLDDLKSQFSYRTLTATLQCAGNRRRELADAAPIDDQLSWGCEAIGNAVWGGVSLAEVLAVAGVKPEARHVAFSGLDTVQHEDAPYGSSIPIEKALRPEVILAYEMNGEPLPQLHGYPLRVITAGYIGARSVKWLQEIRLQEQPSDNYFQAVAYKLFPPQTTPETVQYETGLMLGELSVNAVICTPGEDAALKAGKIQVKGYAMAGGERSVWRVEVSADGGQTWQCAEFLSEDTPWAWRLWCTELNLPAGEHEIVVRAWDTAANTQPESVAAVWNFKGYMNNAWHRVKLGIEG